jgi:hypothetical protein
VKRPFTVKVDELPTIDGFRRLEAEREAALNAHKVSDEWRSHWQTMAYELIAERDKLREQVTIGLSVYRQTGDISAIEAALGDKP